MVRVGPAAFRVMSAWAEPVAALCTLYRAYPGGHAECPGLADSTVRLFPPRPWRRMLRPSVLIGGDCSLPDAAPLPLRHGLLAAEMGMNLQMALGWRRHLLLHASCVEKGGRALVLTGESGSGKSTLAALLGERGWRLLGDEFALLDLVDGSIWPFPRLISLKNQSIGLIAAAVDPARLGPMMAATPKGDIRHLIPRADAISRMDEPAAPALLLFPQFGGDRATRAVPRSETFVRLTQASTNYVALGESGYKALTRFVQTVPAAAIDYATTDEAIDLVDTLWAEIA